MAQTIWTFETAYDGTPVASGDIADTAKLSAQQVNPANSITFNAAAAARGTLGVRCTGTTSVFRLQPGGGTGAATDNQMAWLFAFAFATSSTLASFAGMAGFRHAAGNVALLRWQIDNSLTLNDANGTLVGTVLPAGSSQTTKRWYSFVLNNTSGVYSLRVLTLAGVLINEVSGTRVWSSTAAMGPIQLGVSTALASSVSADFDHVVIGLSESAHIAIPVVAEPPLASPVVTVTKVEPSTVGGLGEFTATWLAINGAVGYKVSTPPLPGSVTTGESTTTTITALTYTWTAQTAGTRTIHVQAI